MPTTPEPPGAQAIASCPSGAISSQGVDQGRCIRCARCLPEGFAFRGPVESSTGSRSELAVGPPSATAGGVLDASPPLDGFARSLHVFLVDAGSCNSCNLEVLALSNPLYDSQRLGIFFTNSPRHADALVVVGVPTEEMVPSLQRAYEALPEPKLVVAVGACPISGGAFAGTPGLAASLDDVLPVDVYVPGCPPTPVQVLDGLLRAVGRARPREVA
ncbi:MAG TPA: NADH-quinone oxidoreductase subunit NuoB [Thermoplasmata archaeon]|nr:NADH-quinone oxidoreductase subunit NuoB [Thermoplasmata archaeon]